MPVQPSAAQIRFNNILTALGVAVATFEVVADSFKAPFLQPIFNTMQSLLAAVQTVKKNKNDVTQMLEQIYELLYAIMHLHISSDTRGELAPDLLKHLGNFAQTLHKIYTFVEAQQEKSRIMQFFRQGEMGILLKACHHGLEQALEVFGVHIYSVSPSAVHF
ncbi:hypothetical protein DFH09DRAFT_1286013 [Mycena vulgaris]|nr:hypothetical protein DFH09DRAFT_1286013 [Mycena vulgaris]